MAYKSFAGMDEDENRFLHELPWDPEPWFSVPADNQHPEGLAWAPAEFEDLVAFDPQPVEIEDHRRIVHSVRHKKTPSNDPNAPKVRGMSTGKGAADTVARTKTKFKLVFDDSINGPDDPNAASAAAHNIGATIRNQVHMIAPSFLSLPKTEMYRVVVGLKETHEWEKDDIRVRRWVLKVAHDIYRRFKGECSKAYKEMGADVARTVLPIDFTQGRNSSWTWLCDHFASEDFRKKSTANKANRGELQMVHHGGPHAVAYHVQALERAQEPFPLLRTFEEKYVKNAQEGPAYELHAALRAEADRRMHDYMQTYNVDLDTARVEVGKTERDIIKDVKEARNPGRRKVDLDFMGQIGQPPLSQDAVPSRSSRTRAGRTRRSSGSSSQGEHGSVLSPTPRELELEKKIKKMEKKHKKMEKKHKKDSSWKKKLLGALKSVCKDTSIIEELDKEADESASSSDDEMSMDQTVSEDTSQSGPQAYRDIRAEGVTSAVPLQAFIPPPDPTVTAMRDMSLENAVDEIFGYPMPYPQMIPTPNWRPVPEVDQGTSSRNPIAAKDKGKQKMQVRRRSTRRSRNDEIEEEAGSSPEP